MKKEFNLSEKDFDGYYTETDVKEFIRLLKEEFCECNKMDEGYACDFCVELNKLAGEKLVE